MANVLSGAGGERFAEAYLVERGAVVLARNYTVPGGEIDLIVRWEGRIVFVEVKSRFSRRYGSAGEAITPAKAHFVRRAALYWLKDNGGTAQPVRFDAILLTPQGLRHIPGAF